MKIAWNKELADRYSFRALIAKRHGWRNLNFASHGNSNQKQFRKAKIFFASEQFRQLQDGGSCVLVLWGITSTARYEYFAIEKQQMLQAFLNHNDAYARFMIKHCYDHQHELFELATQMLHWNEFFQSLGIENYWFDTFNHHDYSVHDPSLAAYKTNYIEVAGPDWPSWEDYVNNRVNWTSAIGQEISDVSRFEFAEFVRTHCPQNFVVDHAHARDLASQLATRLHFQGPLDQTHLSDWKIDNDKIAFLTEYGLLNPHTFHPTQEAHQAMAEMFDPLFERT